MEGEMGGNELIHVIPLVTPLSEGPSITVDVEKFEYAYKCTHCGHQWSEMHLEEQGAKPHDSHPADLISTSG